MTINLTELERLAKVATPGPWSVDEYLVNTDWHATVAECIALPTDTKEHLINASFIAALDPQTVLALIRCARAAVQLDDAYERGSDGHNLAGRIKAVRVIARDFTLSA